MGLLTLLFALGGAISETVRENAENRRAAEEQRRYEDIDWSNIKYVTLDCTETAYCIETEEEFDPVATDFLTRQDGWQHYETKTVEYEVENGLNYCFTIGYKNGTEIYRKFHESSWLTERLLEYCNNEVADDTFDDSYVNNSGTLSQQNAIKTARNYLMNCSGFSYTKLIHQLEECENFSHEDAVYAADNCGANWNNQALKSAKSYLTNCSGFSYTRLLHQLQSCEEFTPEQAKYAVDNSDADWNAQALKSAKSYLDCFDYSRQRLIEQLKNQEEFTDEQVEYAADAVGFAATADTKPETPKERFAVIDFETTGLNHNFHNAWHDEIISVAIVNQDGNVVLDTYCDTINKKSWDEAERIHGISPSDVEGYPTFAQILPEVLETLLSYDYVIAYNAKFERGFLFGYAMHYLNGEQSALKIRWGNDPMEMFKEYMNSSKYIKLEVAAEHFGYDYNAHDALEDTKATLYVYQSIRNAWGWK